MDTEISFLRKAPKEIDLKVLRRIYTILNHIKDVSRL